MLRLNEPAALDSVPDPFIRTLIEARFQALADEGVADEDLAEYIVVEAGDRIAQLEAEAGIWITSSPFSDARFGDSDFAPCFEVLEEHPGHCFELVHVLNDSGFAVITIVPDAPGIDPELLEFCRAYASPSPDQIVPTDSRPAYVPPG